MPQSETDLLWSGSLPAEMEELDGDTCVLSNHFERCLTALRAYAEDVSNIEQRLLAA